MSKNNNSKNNIKTTDDAKEFMIKTLEQAQKRNGGSIEQKRKKRG